MFKRPCYEKNQVLKIDNDTTIKQRAWIMYLLKDLSHLHICIVRNIIKLDTIVILQEV